VTPTDPQPAGGSRSWRRPLDRRPALALAAVLVVAAFGIRIAEVKRTSYRPIGDAISYLQLGDQITQSGGYANTNHAAGYAHGPTAYFPPAYPYLIAATDELTGQRGDRGSVVQSQRIVQAAVGTLSVVIIGLIAYELFGTTTALISLAIAAVYPAFVELSAVLVAENLLTLLELLAVYSAVRALRDHGRLGWLIACGVCVGLATLAHTNGIALLLPLAVAMWRLPGVGGPRRAAGPALLVGVTLLTLLPWLIRDQVVMHRFIPVSDEAGITLVGTYNSASAGSHPPYKWIYYANIPEYRQLAQRAGRLTEPQLGSQLLSRAADYIGNNPTAPLAAAFHNTLRMLELEGSFAWRSSAAAIGLDGGTARIGVIGFWLVLLLAIAGAFTPLARQAPLWVWGVPLVMALSTVFVNGETPRFREPVDPFLILLAACALTTGANAVGDRITRLTAAPHYDVASRIKGT
jgi:4-amino-4-deoxy-L-arabinose transferase-like glycosyltransferase